MGVMTENDIDKLEQKWFSTGWEKALEEIVLLLSNGASTETIHNFCLEQLNG